MSKYFTHTPKSIARRIKEKRGMGTGPGYKPWITVHDFPSLGRIHRIWDSQLRIIRQFFSDLEEKVYLMYWWAAAVTQIREQFPLLPQDETIAIAGELGMKHPADPKTRHPIVMTTDFFLDCESSYGKIHCARTVKYSSALKEANVLKKFEIERAFWERRGVDWKMVTEVGLSFDTAFSIKWVYPCYSPHSVGMVAPEIIDEVRVRMLKGVEGEHFPFRELARECDWYFGLQPATSVNIVRHLIARKVWRVDMTRKIWKSKVMKFLGTSK